MTTAHRVSLLRSSLRRYPDPTRSRNPRVRILISQLSELTLAPAPDPQFRSELRAQLVAITPRIVAEAGEQVADEADSSAAPASAARADRRPWFGKSLKIATAALVVIVLALGGTVWLSRSALPGDSLYGVKRASESLQLALDSSDTERAADYLHFAQTRTAEVQGLLDRSKVSALGAGVSAASAVDHATAGLIVQTLHSANDDVRSAASLLGRAALAQHSTAPLRTMTSWARGQMQRLAHIWTDLPLGNLRTQAAAAKALVVAAAHRATALHRLATCTACTPRTGSDPLGPLPCAKCTPIAPNTGGDPGSNGSNGGANATATPGSTQRTGSTPGGPAAPGNGSGNGNRNGTGHAQPSSSQPATLPGGGILNPTTPTTSAPDGNVTQPTSPLPTLPSLPLPLPTSASNTGSTTKTAGPKLPLPKASVGSCGATISLGGIQLGLGNCSNG